MNSFEKIKAILTKKELANIYLLLIPACFTAVINVVGIAFIAPFVAVASDAKAIQHYKKLAWLYDYLHFESSRSFLLFLGVAALAMLIIVNSLNAFTAWVTMSVVSWARSSISHRLFKHYLQMPYSFFLYSNSASLSSNIFNLVNQVTEGVLQACINLVATVLVTTLILGLVFVINPFLALSSMLLIGSFYSVIYLVVRYKLIAISKDNVTDESESYRIVSEGFGGIKDIKLFGCEAHFLSEFWVPQKALARNRAVLFGIQQVPKYALEVVAFGGVVALIIYMLALNHDFSAIAPTLALYIFSGYKLMPAIQQLFSQMTTLRSSISSLNILYDCLGNEVNKSESKASNKTDQRLIFENNLKLKGLCFKYPNSKNYVTNMITMLIKANTLVGFIGSTGSGKTTLVDLILGLLVPTQGVIEVDGVEITEQNRRSWQNNIGYVPQHIYLCDNTIASNIAFGLSCSEIDMNKVRKAAKLAAIDDFIMNKLADGYETEIGERGIRLSGGQRQRIGIARALYNDPTVLILDEATSALDGATEDVIMDAIQSLAHKKTIIIVAHRLSTVSACDVVYLFEDGTIQDQGLFSELVKSNIGLRKMAKLA